MNSIHTYRFATIVAITCTSILLAQDPKPIPKAPTAQDALPPAILGKGSPPAGKRVQYVPGDNATSGYLSIPEGKGPHGAVLLIHEWNGLGTRVMQVADALAAEGYVALAADLYQGKIGKNRDENRALVQEARNNPQAMIENLDHAAAFLRKRPDVSGKIATIGWCFGGGVALSYAIGGVNHEGTAMFYGRLLDDPSQMASIHHEVYGTFAEMDRGIPPEKVNEFVEALRKAGIPNDIHIYDEVRHGFWLWVDRDPAVNKEPALNAWQRLKSYLSRTVGEKKE